MFRFGRGIEPEYKAYCDPNSLIYPVSSVLQIHRGRDDGPTTILTPLSPWSGDTEFHHRNATSSQALAIAGPTVEPDQSDKEQMATGMHPIA